MKSIITILIFGLGFQGLCFAKNLTRTFKSSEVKSLDLKNGSGHVVVLGIDSSEVKVSAELVSWHDKCKFEAQVKSGSLNVKTINSGSSSFFKKGCQANITVSLPVASHLKVKTGSGNISIEKITGNVDANLGSGDASLKNCKANKALIKTGSGNIQVVHSHLKNLDVKSGSGNIHVFAELSEVDASVGSGNLYFKYLKIPTAGSLTANVGSGDTILHFPKAAVLKVDFKAGFGKMQNEFGSVVNAKFSYAVRVKPGYGNLNIKKY